MSTRYILFWKRYHLWRCVEAPLQEQGHGRHAVRRTNLQHPRGASAAQKRESCFVHFFVILHAFRRLIHASPRKTGQKVLVGGGPCRHRGSITSMLVCTNYCGGPYRSNQDPITYTKTYILQYAIDIKNLIN